MTKFQCKMADGRQIGKCWKCYNSPTNRPIWTKLGWSHPIMSPTCPPWCGCHGNSLATAHWTFSSYGRLEAECVNQFWWNLVHNSKLRPQWQSCDEILNFLKFKIADGRHVRKCYNSPTSVPTWTELGWSHRIMSRTCPPWCGCHVIFCSYVHLDAERMNQFWWNLVQNSEFGPQWQSLIKIILKFLKF